MCKLVCECVRMSVRVYGQAMDGVFHFCARYSSHVSSFDPHNNPLREY